MARKNNAALDNEMLMLGFEKSEYATTGYTRVFFSNLDPLRYRVEIDDSVTDCEAPRSIVLELQESKHHRDVYTVVPTLSLNSLPLSDDLKPPAQRLELHEIGEWVDRLKMLFFIEAVRRNYGTEFNSRPDRESEIPGESVFGGPRYGGPA